MFPEAKISLILALIFSVVVCGDEWWKSIAKKNGPNVCVQEKVIGESRSFAYPWTDGNICGKRTVIKLQCCEGYDMVRGEKGCSLVKPLKNLIETAKSFGAKEFVNQTELAGLTPLLSERGAFTVFATTDQAFRSLSNEAIRTIRQSGRGRERPSVLLYSTVESRLYQADLPGYDSLNTMYRDGSLRVQKYSSGAIAINCVPLVAADLEATNGVLHLTESLLLPPSHSNILGLLTKDTTLTALYAAIVRAQLTSELRSRGPFTLFAPVNEAWEALPQEFMESLNGNMESLKSLLKYHIVEDIWCASMAAHESEIPTMEGTTIKMTCSKSGIYLNGATVLKKNKLVGNGVIQFIDKVLIPDKVKTLSDVAESLGLTSFLRFITVTGLNMVMKNAGSYTVFAPTDEAFKALPENQWDELMSDPRLGRSVVSYHMTVGPLLTTNFIDEQMIRTLSTGSKSLRVKMQRKSVAVETSMITSPDHVARNGVLHVIDRVLLPSGLTLADMLAEGNYSGFVSVLNETSPNLLNLLSNQSNTFTVFAPDDEALIELPPGMMTRLLADATLLAKILGNHIIEDYVTINGLKTRMYYQYRTISGRLLTLRKEDTKTVTVGNLAIVKEQDLVARNGILHRISRLIQF